MESQQPIKLVSQSGKCRFRLRTQELGKIQVYNQRANRLKTASHQLFLAPTKLTVKPTLVWPRAVIFRHQRPLKEPNQS